MATDQKNGLTEVSKMKMGFLKHFIPLDNYSPQTTCEICTQKEVPRKEHLRCYYCGKFTCSECAHYQAVFISEPLSMRVQSMRICPNCTIKTRRGSRYTPLLR